MIHDVIKPECIEEYRIRVTSAGVDGGGGAEG